MKKLIAAVVVLAVFAPAALAASAHFVKVSPSKVVAGKAVTVSGAVGKVCQIGRKGDSATISSNAFKGATKKTVAGMPSVSASLSTSKTGTFSVKVNLSKKVKAGTYSVVGRCGHSNFGSTSLKVTKPSTTNNNGLPQAY